MTLAKHPRRALDDNPYPKAPRPDPLKAILAKLDPPAPKPEPLPPLPAGAGPRAGPREAQTLRAQSKDDLATMSALVPKRESWWHVIDYEASMFRALDGPSVGIAADLDRAQWLHNCIPEATVLHTRILCDFCLSPEAQYIKPSDLFSNYDNERYAHIKLLLKTLDKQYGRNKDADSVRNVLSRRLAHPTKQRNIGFDYTPYLARVRPVLHDILNELERLRGVRFSFPAD